LEAWQNGNAAEKNVDQKGCEKAANAEATEFLQPQEFAQFSFWFHFLA